MNNQEPQIETPLYRSFRIDNGEEVVGDYMTTYPNPTIIIDSDATKPENFCFVDLSRLAVKMPNTNLFMALDFKTGKGGDKIKDNEVLVWNSGMMNCSVLSLWADGTIHDYIIDLDSFDFDNFQVIGIQK